MTRVIEVQIAVDAASDLPSEDALRRWAAAALEANAQSAELTLRVCCGEEIHALNRDYRGVDKPTNVLSFPAEAEGWPEPEAAAYLGDVAICAEVVVREAAEQGKASEAHWAHMVIHGVLHLQGYDHIESAEAEQMEARERAILASFHYPDPYLIRD